MNATMAAQRDVTLDQLVGVRISAPQPKKDGRMSGSLLAWAVAPDWVTPAQAAQLMGADYNEEKIMSLVEIGGIVAERRDRALLIELRSLSEYRDALWEVVSA